MKKIYSFTLLLVLLSISIMTEAQTILPLYQGTIPNNKATAKPEVNMGNGRIAGVTVPTLTIFLPEKKDSFLTAVIICPGGGYARLSIDHEGYEVAKAFNQKGIAAFVLKYRIPADSSMNNKEIVPLQDAQRAFQLIREKAKEYNINPDKIGIIGFSAGGHLASTVGTHLNMPVISNENNTNLCPNFLLLAYPVISFADSLAHMGSRDNLIGKNPNEEKIKAFSNELQVTPQTPPTFIVHAADDKTVKVANSILFFESLQKNKVASEIHIYQNGGHGFGLHNATTKENWFETAIHWMTANKLMKGDAIN